MTSFLVLSSLAALISFATALSWCEDSGGQTQVTLRGTTRARCVFGSYPECVFDDATSLYSCTDYCVDERTLAKFHCSLHQPGAERLAKRTYVDCVTQGYAGCSKGACVSALLAATPSPSSTLSSTPSLKPIAWCKAVQSLSASAPSQIVGARSDGSTFAFNDYCSDAKTLVHYYCVEGGGGAFASRFLRCAGECAGGACVPPAVLKPPQRFDYGAWIAYGVIGVIIIACGVALWLYLPKERVRKERCSRKNAVE
ncbi:MAG: hypothetical protein QW343_03920 [Candidatus Norongarragalinales archaeon]